MIKEELISILLQLSKADLNFENQEYAYIHEVGKNMGMERLEVEKIIHSDYKYNLTIPPSEQDRMNILYYLLFLMKVDKSVTDQETKLIYHFGFKLGFSEKMLDDFIQLVFLHQKGKVPIEDMLNIIRRYQN